MKAVKKIILTAAGGPIGVNVARSLNESMDDIYIAGTDSNSYHLHLTETNSRHLVPSADRTNEYVEELNEITRQYDIDLVSPQSDTEVRVISENRSKLDAKVFLPSPDAIRHGQNKYEANSIWERAGLPVPKTIKIEDKPTLQQAFDDIKSRPIWVRKITATGRASLPCMKIEHARFWIDYWNGWGDFIASEFLPGKNLTWLGLYKDGQLICSQGRERIEYIIPHVSPSGITGTPAVSRTVSRDDVNEISERAVFSIDPKPHGIYFVDLKEDKEGIPNLTEINLGRFNTTIYFYTRAGVNYPWIYLKLFYDEEIPKVKRRNSLPPGLYWIRTIDTKQVLLKL